MEAMRRYADVRKAVEAAAEPLWRKLGPRAANEAAVRPPSPPGAGENRWSLRASPVPLPHVWPPDEVSLLDIPVFAYCISGRIADGERQAAPFMRAVVEVRSGDVVGIEPLAAKFRELGVQGVQPVPAAHWEQIETGILRLREAVAAGALPDAAAAAEIRNGYGAFLRLNGLIAPELEGLQPTFARWLGYSARAPVSP